MSQLPKPISQEQAQPQIETAADLDTEWVTYVPDRQYGVNIASPEIGAITATLTIGPETASPGSALYIDMFVAKQPGQGSGKKLIQLLKQEGQKYGARSISGHFTSKAALGAFVSVMGNARLHFRDAYRNRYSGTATQVTIDEAMKQPHHYIATAYFDESPPLWQHWLYFQGRIT